MAAKTTTKTKPEPKVKAKNEAQAFSYEFLDMLADTAYTVLSAELKKAKVSKDLADLLDIFYWIQTSQTSILEGQEQCTQWVADEVTSAVRLISIFDGEWHSPTGRVISLKERRANRAKE